MQDKYVNSIQNIHIISLFLHPNYKSLSLLQQEPLKCLFSDFDILQSLQDLFPSDFELVKPALKRPAISEAVVNHQLQNSNSDPISDDELMDSGESPEAPQVSEKSIFDEIVEYQQMKSPKYSEPIEFWKASKFIKLKKIALSVFSVTSSSAEPERHNSHAGLTITDLRNQLNFESVESLVLYKTFMKI